VLHQCVAVDDIDQVQATLLRHNENQFYAGEPERADVTDASGRPQSHQTVAPVSTHTLRGRQGGIRSDMLLAIFVRNVGHIITFVVSCLQ